MIHLVMNAVTRKEGISKVKDPRSQYIKISPKNFIIVGSRHGNKPEKNGIEELLMYCLLNQPLRSITS